MKRIVMGSALTFLIGVGAAHATTLVNNPDLDIQGPGVSVAEGGIGLEALGAGSLDIEVEINGPVLQAFLYWVGRDGDDCEEDAMGDCVVNEPYRDQEIVFNGEALTGTYIGSELNVAPTSGRKNNIGYRADVTDIVTEQVLDLGPGVHAFSFEDGNLASNLLILNGAGLFVVYEDESVSDVFRVRAADGLDFAWKGDLLAPALVTVPVTYTYAASPDARSAELFVFAGDNDTGRRDRVLISDNPPINDQLTSVDGETFDTIVLPFTIPGGVGSTTVELVSPPEFNSSDSILWVLGAVRIPVPCEDLCEPIDLCHIAACDDAAGCVQTPIVCRAANPCHTAVCEPTVGCVESPIVCEPSDACHTSQCVGLNQCVETPILCEPADACHTAVCDPVDGCIQAPISCEPVDNCHRAECDPVNGCIQTPSPCCGDGNVDDGEECDDGNNDDGDGCSADCMNEGECIVTCDAEVVVDEPGCGPCDGKVSALTLKYNGSYGATIKVKQKKPFVTVFEGMVAPGGTFSFVGMDDRGTLSTEISIYVNGTLKQTIHTSCSQPIGIGSVFGKFEVVAGESRNGGPFCPVGSDDDDDTDTDEEVLKIRSNKAELIVTAGGETCTVDLCALVGNDGGGHGDSDSDSDSDGHGDSDSDSDSDGYGKKGGKWWAKGGYGGHGDSDSDKDSDSDRDSDSDKHHGDSDSDHGDSDSDSKGDGEKIRIGYSAEGDCEEVTAIIDIGCDLIEVTNGQLVDLVCDGSDDDSHPKYDQKSGHNWHNAKWGWHKKGWCWHKAPKSGDDDCFYEFVDGGGHSGGDSDSDSDSDRW